MKRLYKKFLPYLLSLEILLFSLFSCSITVYAVDFMPTDIIAAVEYGIENNDWEPFWRFLYNSSDGLMFLFSQMGAITTQDFVKWVNNNKALESLAETVPTPAKKEGDNIVFTQELMAQLKTLLDDYAKENQQFVVVPTYRAKDIPTSVFYDKAVYDYFLKYVSEHHYTVFHNETFYNEPRYLHLGDATQVIKDGGGFVRKSTTSCYIVNSNWDYENIRYNRYRSKIVDDKYEVYDVDGKEYYSTFLSYTWEKYNSTMYNSKDCGYIVTSDGGKIRVFNTLTDFTSYSVGQRKVYYTSNYYNYVPEDLTVSIDELQKTIEDMQDVIDKLLDQITNDTSESEIEELLRQILEELRNQQGGGGGSGGGGGDVTVDVDLKYTNSLLERILAQLRSIWSEMHKQLTRIVEDFESFFIFEDAPGINAKYISSLLERILAKLRTIFPESGTEVEGTSWLEEVLEDIRDTLKSIRRWSIADTVFDGVDALADVASFLKDFLTAPAAAIGTAASSLGETANMLTDKFPFSIPWDMAALVTLLSAEPQAPVFKLPITIESAGIEEYMEIDMSQFEYLSTIMRGMLSILYAYGILSMTTKVMDIGGKK